MGALVDHYFKKKEDVKAIETLEQMGKADPLNGRVQLFLSEVYRQRGRRKEYLKSLEMAFMGEGVDFGSKNAGPNYLAAKQ